MSIQFEGLEIDICGVTFLVSGDYYSREEGDFWNPPVPANVEIDSDIKIKGQPDGDGDTLLEAIKTNVRIRQNPVHLGEGVLRFDSGMSILKDAILDYFDNQR